MGIFRIMVATMKRNEPMCYSDFDPQDIDPETGRPYSNYSSPSLDTSFHDGEMDIDDEDGDA